MQLNKNVLDSFAVQFAGRLPTITALVVGSPPHGKSLRPVHPATFASLSSFQSLTTLELRACRFRSFAQLQRLICAFPNLSTLRVLDRCSFDHLPASIPPLQIDTQINRPRLTSLDVDVHNPDLSAALVSWLSQRPSTTEIICSISLPPPDEREECLSNFLGRLGSCLTELRFGGTATRLHLGMFFNIDILTHHSLDQLLVSLGRRQLKLVLLAQTRTLSNFQLSTRLRSLSLVVGATAVSSRPFKPLTDKRLGDASDWQPLDELLAEKASLEEIQFTVLLFDQRRSFDQNAIHRAACVAEVERLLPKLHRRQILKVDVQWGVSNYQS